MLKFFYNGIKGESKELQKAFYSLNKTDRPDYYLPVNTITIFKDRYKRFTHDIREVFTVENDSDSHTDYFENDRIRVTPDHPLYSQVLEAYNKQEEKKEAHAKKRGLVYSP